MSDYDTALSGFDYPLPPNAIRVSDAGACVVLWFSPSNRRVAEHMTQLAGGESGRVRASKFCRKIIKRGIFGAAPVLLTEVENARGIIRVWFEYRETVDKAVEWAKANGVHVIMDSAQLAAPESASAPAPVPAPAILKTTAEAEAEAEPSSRPVRPAVGSLLPVMPLPPHLAGRS